VILVFLIKKTLQN